MPLLSFVRFVTGLLSLAILASSGWLLWTWYDGRVAPDLYGVPRLIREDWRLWLGLGLLAWSFVGRWFLLPLLARRDDRPTRPAHGEGRTMPGATGSTLHVETHGPVGGPPIIFVHGWGMDSTFWSYARQDLGDRFRLFLWDLPGLGRSKPAAPDAIDLPAFAEDLAGLIGQHGRQRIVLVGHSIGGMIIQTLIREQPAIQDRLAGVVLLNTTHTNPLRTMILASLARALQKPLIEPAMKLTILLSPLVWLQQWQSYLSGSTHLGMRLGFGRAVTRSQLDHVALLATRNAPAVQARGNLAMFRWDGAGALERLYVPLLVIGGGADIVTLPDASKVLVRDGRLGELALVGDANHLGPMERAELYNRHIAEFALRVQRGAATDRARLQAVEEEQRRDARDRPADRPPSTH